MNQLIILFGLFTFFTFARLDPISHKFNESKIYVLNGEIPTVGQWLQFK